MTRPAVLLVAALLALSLPAAGQPEAGVDPHLAELSSPSARTRVRALEALARAGRPEAAAPVAALLADGDDRVRGAAIETLLALYTVRAPLAERQWGPGSPDRPTTFPEQAFEAGPLATLPAAVPEAVLTGLSAAARQDRALKVRLAAAYALGTLGAGAMGPMSERAASAVAAELAAALQHPDRPTRQVVARVAGRVFAPPGRQVPAVLGDALIASMNDGDPLVRRWAMDSLGWLRYDRAVQSLTERASYYGKGEQAAAAYHALARIADASSAPLFRALLANRAPTFRVIAVEGLGRIGDRSAYAAITDSAMDANHANVTLAAHLAAFLLAQTDDVTPLAAALRSEDTQIQGRVYLAEVAQRQPSALHPLLQSPDAWVRRGTAELLGTSRRPSDAAMLQPLLADPSPQVVEAASEAIRRLRAWAAVAPPP